MSIANKVAALSSSAHTGRALKAAKVLNLIGTVRGAVTTVLLASSAIGGAVTVNNVRQDIVKDQSAATPPARVASPRTTAPSVATPLTSAGLRADAQQRLQTGLDQAAQAADDLRRVSILTVAGTEALVTQTRQKLQARFDQAITQVDALLAPPPSAPPQPSAGLSVVAVNSLVQVALGDMTGVLFVATRLATEPTTIAGPRSPVPSTPTPVRTATPTLTQPPRTPTATVKATPVR